MFDLFSLEAGIGQHWSRVRLIDNDFEDQAEDFSIKIKNSSYHWNYYAAVSAYYRIKNSNSYLYGKFGLSINTYEESSVSDASNFSISSLNIDRSIEYSTTYEHSNYSFIPEIGYQYKFYKGNILNIGLRYNMGQSKAFESNYTITDNVSGESRTDGLSSNGDAITFTVRYDFRLLHFNKKERAKKIKLDEIAIDVSKKEEPTAADTILSDRELVVSDRIKVKNSQVIVSIWDHQTVDGDRVSLMLNGKWILENYKLKKEKHLMKVELKEGINTFVLHALNLGEIEPNTAALIVDDGEKRHKIILQSNMKRSGTLQIKYKK